MFIYEDNAQCTTHQHEQAPGIFIISYIYFVKETYISRDKTCDSLTLV